MYRIQLVVAVVFLLLEVAGKMLWSDEFFHFSVAFAIRFRAIFVAQNSRIFDGFISNFCTIVNAQFAFMTVANLRANRPSDIACLNQIGILKR